MIAATVRVLLLLALGATACVASVRYVDGHTAPLLVAAAEPAPAVRLNSVCWSDRFPIVKKDDA